MATPRVGALGVGTTKGDLFVVNDSFELERVPVGASKQVLTSDPTSPLGVAWKDPNFVQNVSLQCDAADAIFKTVTLGGVVANPAPATRGTHAVLGFNDTTVQGIPWQKSLPVGYTAGANLRVNIYWVAATAVADDVVWAAAFERDNAGRDITADGFAALQTAAPSAAPATAGVIQLATITFTQAQADSVAAGEPFRLFVQRTASDPGDTMVGDAQIVRVVVEEIQP